MDNLEELLRKRQDAIAEHIPIKTSKRQTAETSADLYDFIKMVDKLVTITMKDLKVEFVPDEGKQLVINNDTLEHPYITYKIISREPKGELKPRIRDVIQEEIYDTNTKRLGYVYGQKFACIVQFDIFASVNEVANKVMNMFEELMFSYTRYFKKNGVAEIFFKKQFTDENYTLLRQKISVRNVQYYIEIEKLITVFEDEIENIYLHS